MRAAHADRAAEPSGGMPLLAVVGVTLLVQLVLQAYFFPLSALWDAARDGLQEEGCTTVTSWVPLRNERALRFHELAGFKREMSTAKTSVVGSVKIEEVRLQRPLN